MHILNTLLVIVALVVIPILFIIRDEHRKKPPTQSWWIGHSAEWFNTGPFASREEAIEVGVGYGWEKFYIGVAGEYTPFSRNLIEDLWEQECCDIDDHCGPSASDNWPERPNFKNPKVIQANNQIRIILRKLFGHCPVFPIENMEVYPPEVSK